jgi:uncharacterized protein (DUF1697 family)
MPEIIISLLRGVNVGGHNMIKMDALRTLYESLKLGDAKTYLQSGNVVFKAGAQALAGLPKRIEDAIEGNFGFRPSVIHRTAAELRDAIARNPFAARPGIEPSKLWVTFLAGDPSSEAREKVLAMKTDPEELRMDGRELFIYFPNGMARPKIPMAQIERALKLPTTSRNWNTVRKLLEIADAIEAAGSSRKTQS